MIYPEEKLLRFHTQLANYLHIVRTEQRQWKTQHNCCLQSPNLMPDAEIYTGFSQ